MPSVGGVSVPFTGPQEPALPPPPAPGPTMPAAVPTQNLGDQAKGAAVLQIAVKNLDQALALYPTGSEPWEAIVAAMKQLGKYAVPVSPQITAAELKLQGAQTPDVPPMLQAMAGAKDQLGAMGLGGPPPPNGGGAPPMM